MKHDPQSLVEIRDVAAGLWVWRVEHPRWKANQGWEPIVASTCVESGSETLVLDPLAPPAGASEVWSGSTRTRRPRSSFSSRITFGTSIGSSAATVPAPSARAASTVTTSPRPSWSPSALAACFQEVSSPSTTDGAATRLRSGCPSSEPSSHDNSVISYPIRPVAYVTLCMALTRIWLKGRLHVTTHRNPQTLSGWLGGVRVKLQLGNANHRLQDESILHSSNYLAGGKMKSAREAPTKMQSDLMARMDAVERLTKLFGTERLVHLIVTTISLIMLLSVAGRLIYKNQAGAAELTGLFGSSGLITYSAGRLLHMWTQALSLLSESWGDKHG
jgi:hypothetical protein